MHNSRSNNTVFHIYFKFSSWMDAVLLVFSLESEDSFSRVYSYYNRMCSFRNMVDIPKVLVGVQGKMAASLILI